MSKRKLALGRKADAFVAAALLCLNINLASAQTQPVAHYNAVALIRDSASSVQFVFSLNLPQVWHALLAPRIAYRDFLQSYANLSDPALDKEVAKASAALSADAHFTWPSGNKANLKHWQWPDKQTVRDSFRANLVLLNGSASANSHVDPVPVLAQARTKTPSSRVQLQLPSALYPIAVSLPHDKFWLTEQIPMALVELP
jgi:hypothetical protein